MSAFNDITDLFDFPLYYKGSDSEPNGTGFPALPASNPPNLCLPRSPTSDSTSPSPSDWINSGSPPSLITKEPAEVDYSYLDFFLPPQVHTHMAEPSSMLAPQKLPPFAASPTLTNASVPSASSASSPRDDVSPTAPPQVRKGCISSPTESPRAHQKSKAAKKSFASKSSPKASLIGSPKVLKRPRSSSESSTSTESPGAGPSMPNPRPTKQPRPPPMPLPGEFEFQVDLSVPALASTNPPGPPLGRNPRQRIDYSPCKCRSRTLKPARHWRTACPYNPNRTQNRVRCEFCDETFSRHDNMDRHMEDFH